jgi:methylmalonyl-CoA mutase, C-terminal domain
MAQQEHVMIATLGLDQHENGAVAVARILREAQMRVSYLGRFQTPQSLAAAAARERPDAIGVSCHSWEYLDLVPALIGRLRERGLATPVVIGGSIITAADARRMRQAGVAAVVAGAVADDDIVEVMRGAARAGEEAEAGA